MGSYYKKISFFTAVAAIFFFIAELAKAMGVFNAYYERVAIMIFINIIMALSANLIINITGQLTLGHSAFMAIGAYISAILTLKTPLPFFLVLLSGAVVAAAAGFLIGLPTLRLRGDYLAITTLGFCQIVVVIFQNIPVLGGSQGLTGIPWKTNFLWSFGLMCLTVFLLYNLVRSRHGSAMISVREDEIAARSLGINTTRYKITAFTVGAFFAGIAGGLYAHFMMYIEPSTFDYQMSINYLIYVVLGGTGSFTGCIISTALLSGALEALREFGSLTMVIYPLLLIFIMITRMKNLSPIEAIKRLRTHRRVSAKGGK